MLLSVAEVNTPAGVRVEAAFDAYQLTFITESRHRAQLGIYLMVISWFVLFLVVLPSTLIWLGALGDGPLTVIFALWMCTWGLPVISWLANEYLNSRTVKTLHFGLHHVEGVSANNIKLPRWTVHDLEEAWASQDAFSSIVAVRRRNGEVDALRVETAAIANWLAGALEEWRQTHATQPDAQAESLIRAVSERVGEPG